MLFTSFGTPMLWMGDEIGLTRNGNNNPWCQDAPMNWMNWNAADPEILEGVKTLIRLRNSIDFLSQQDYSFTAKIKFLDARGNKPDPHSYGNFIAMVFDDPKNHCKVYIAFNSSNNSFIVQLPKTSDGKKWTLQWSTYEFLAKRGHNGSTIIEDQYPITGQSCLIAFQFEKS
jgi:pullulanase/glycogen debranching enzyme